MLNQIKISSQIELKKEYKKKLKSLKEGKQKEEQGCSKRSCTVSYIPFPTQIKHKKVVLVET